MKIQTDKQSRYNSTINVFNEIVEFDKNGVAEVSDELGKKLLDMEDISKSGKKQQKEERIEDTAKAEDKVESSQTENISESGESEPLQKDESSDDEVPADTAKKEFQNMGINELKKLAIEYNVISEEGSKAYKGQDGKGKLVDLLVEKVSG